MVARITNEYEAARRREALLASGLMQRSRNGSVPSRESLPSITR